MERELEARAPMPTARPRFMPLGFLIIRNKVNRKIATETTAFESVSLHSLGTARTFFG